MQPQLAEIEASFESARARLRRLVTGLNAERWGRRPRPESWSAAECVAHLNLTSRAYVTLLRDAFTRAPRGVAPGRYRRDPMGWLIALSSGPMLRIGRKRFGRTKTIPAFVPGGELPMAHVLAEFERLQDEQIALVRLADGLPLGRLRIASPFAAGVTYNAYSALTILPGHQHRHLEQAERAVAEQTDSGER